MSQYLHINNLDFSYNSSPLLFKNLSISFSSGWTGIAGSNGSGKSTLLKLISGQLSPERGSIHTPAASGFLTVYVPQEGCCDPVAGQSLEILQDGAFEGDKEALKWMNLLGVNYDWFFRIETLSFGEQKKLLLASVLYRNPDCLCLDEPVNHLDSETRETMTRALKLYKGIGILVSHDRHLLNELPRGILFLESEGSAFYHGDYTLAVEEKRKKDLGLRRERNQALREVRKLNTEAAHRRALAASQHARRSKKHLDRKDSDGRAKLDLVRVSGKDGTGGKLLRQMEGRRNQADSKLSNLQISRFEPTGITMTGRQSKSDRLWQTPGLMLPLNEGERHLEIPELTLKPADRIVLRGPNGSGKTSLLKHIIQSGDLDPSTYFFLPQEFSPGEMDQVRKLFQGLSDRRKGEVLSAVARLGSNPEYLRDSLRYSPGEARKVFLAISLTGEESPALLILDEPENHLDLPSVRFLEEALREYPGALLIVSHDREFSGNLTDKVWEITRQNLLMVSEHTG